MDGGSGSPSERQDQRSLRSLQSALIQHLGRLIRYAYDRGYELTLGEGYVQSPRSCEVVVQARCPRCAHDFEFKYKGFGVDRVHMPSSLHHTRLAQDLNLFVRGEFVTNGEHFAWVDLGNYWEQLDPSCSWGGRFKTHDSNHLSMTFGGRR